MNDLPLAIITGANGDMGIHITRAVAQAGYPVIMACNNTEDAERKRELIASETGNSRIEVEYLELLNLKSVADFAERIRQREMPVGLLMNNAGIMPCRADITKDGINNVVSVNYAAPYLLTRLLLPLMHSGARIVNMISCTYAIGKLDMDTFFETGGRRKYSRVPVYSNTKLALLLFTLELAERLKGSGISINAVDPGIVSTKFIHLDCWFDPLTDILFRPCIRKPEEGAETAIHTLLNPLAAGLRGEVLASCKVRNISDRFRQHALRKELWDATEQKVGHLL